MAGHDPSSDRCPARPGRRLRSVLLGGALFVATLLPATNARATVVERVVAVVGDRAILMSDLRERAVPFLVRIQNEVPVGAQRAAAISQVYTQLLERLIEEELLVRAARRAKLSVTEQEITAAIERVAKQNKISAERLLAEAVANGMTEAKYRDELRRQLLDARLTSLRIQGQVRVRDEDLRATYRAIVLKERQKQRYTASWIVLDGSSASTSADLAAELAQRVRVGESFEALARGFSLDPSTRGRGGALGQLQPGQLAPSLDKVALALDVGEVSAPIRVGTRLVLLKLTSREATQLPSFNEARAELQERVYSDKMAKARKRWLDGLRRQTHVEVRL